VKRLFQGALAQLKGIPNSWVARPVSIGVLAWALAALLAFGPATPARAQPQTESLSTQQVIEYALTLEKLEADFYQRAADAVASGQLGDVPQPAIDAIQAYGEDEAQHVADLSQVLSALDGNPDQVTIPEEPNYTAILDRDPFASVEDLLLAGQLVEDLGVAAYKGQVTNLQAEGQESLLRRILPGQKRNPGLAGALEIHSVEARHAAGLRYLRQSLLDADIRPWIRSGEEVIYTEERSGSTIPYASEAFDGYATRSEVLELVNPVLQAEAAPQPAPEDEQCQCPPQQQQSPQQQQPPQPQPEQDQTEQGGDVRGLW